MVDMDCIVLTIVSVALGIGLYTIIPKPVPGERRTLRWIGVLIGALGLLS